MNSGLLLVTHAGIASALLSQAAGIIGTPLDGVQVMEISEESGTTLAQLRAAVRKANQGFGVLIITDLPCATPANLAVKARTPECRIISGLNLPMLLRAWNYRDRPAAELVEIALQGARKAITELP